MWVWDPATLGLMHWAVVVHLSRFSCVCLCDVWCTDAVHGVQKPKLVAYVLGRAMVYKAQMVVLRASAQAALVDIQIAAAIKMSPKALRPRPSGKRRACQMIDEGAVTGVLWVAHLGCEVLMQTPGSVRGRCSRRPVPLAVPFQLLHLLAQVRHECLGDPPWRMLHPAICMYTAEAFLKRAAREVFEALEFRKGGQQHCLAQWNSLFARSPAPKRSTGLGCCSSTTWKFTGLCCRRLSLWTPSLLLTPLPPRLSVDD